MILAQSTLNVNSNSGLFATSRVLSQLTSFEAFGLCESKSLSNQHAFFPTTSIAKAMIALMTLGKSSFEDIASFKEDTLMKEVLKRDIVPSKETLRQRIDGIATSDHWSTCIDQINVEILQRVKDFGLQRTCVGDVLVIDIDVSVLDNSDTKKEGVEWTYKKCTGFAPIFATIGTIGYQIANELRPGSTHSQKGAVEFVRRVITLAKQITDKHILVRMDSAHDADDMLAELFTHEDVWFIIKRNPRKEQPEKIYDWIKASGAEKQVVSNTKDRYSGVIAHKKTESTIDLPLFMAFELELEEEGDLFGKIETTRASYWTNLPGEAEEIVELYHLHATSEQFHSEIKSDMDIERLPSQKFKTNQLVLALSTLAFNVLRLIGQTALEFKHENQSKTKKQQPQRSRLRTVLLNVMYTLKVG